MTRKRVVIVVVRVVVTVVVAGESAATGIRKSNGTHIGDCLGFDPFHVRQ